VPPLLDAAEDLLQLRLLFLGEPEFLLERLVAGDHREDDVLLAPVGSAAIAAAAPEESPALAGDPLAELAEPCGWVVPGGGPLALVAAAILGCCLVVGRRRLGLGLG